MQNPQALSSTLSLNNQTENIFLINKKLDSRIMMLGYTAFFSGTAILLPSQHLQGMAAAVAPESINVATIDTTDATEKQLTRINPPTSPLPVTPFQSRSFLNVLEKITTRLFPGQTLISPSRQPAQTLFPFAVTTNLNHQYQIGNPKFQLASLVSTSSFEQIPSSTETIDTQNNLFIATKESNYIGDLKLTISPQLGSKYLENQKIFISSLSTKDLNLSDSSYFLAQSNRTKTTKSSQSSLPTIKSQNLDNDPYISKLRAEIEELRNQYQNQVGEYRADNSLNRKKPRKFLPNNFADSTSSVSINQNQVTEIKKPEKNQDIISVAPTNAENYNSVLETPTGEKINPQLPSLDSPEEYLPEAFDGYSWPAQGVLSSGFGWRWGRFHKGIDIAAPIGTPVFAAAHGEVIFADWNSGGYGKLVKMRHPDGSVTLYAHNNKILVRKGQKIEQGQQIAEIGNTGFSTGPHLHFEIRPNGEAAVNPIALLSKK